jgi:hypothetical protein
MPRWRRRVSLRAPHSLSPFPIVARP